MNEVNYQRILKAVKGAINGVDYHCNANDISNSWQDSQRWHEAKCAAVRAWRRELGIYRLPQELYDICVYLADVVHYMPGMPETWVDAYTVFVNRLTRASEVAVKQDGIEEV
jgi:hypothetical protein